VKANVVVGKTVDSILYRGYELVSITFTDGTILDIHQTSQSGNLNVYVNLDEITADNYEELFK
jgi:hypothetical protein